MSYEKRDDIKIKRHTMLMNYTQYLLDLICIVIDWKR